VSTIPSTSGDTPGGPSWQRAVSFAARHHKNQLRRDKRTPYVAHVFRVAMTVRDCFGLADAEALCAAVLHDTIEDTPVDFDDIEEDFGTTVAEMVASLTKNMLLREDQREIDYDQRLARADWRVRLIKLADVYDNSCDLATWSKSGKGALARMNSRCQRAIELAQGDASTHPETARAIEIVRALLQTRSD
jgi:(p)ppGpp synthase/HD superfamily hydrolase